MQSLLVLLAGLDTIVWSYLAVPGIILLGSLLSLRYGFPQFKQTALAFKGLKNSDSGCDDRGLHPLKVFLTSIGGCIGVGNLVAVCTAVQIGGPGAVFWMWIAAFLGMVVKYAEVYLGINYRVKNNRGGYDGGPMYYLQNAFGVKWICILFAFLLSIYGAEIYLFRVLVDTISINFNWNQIFTTFLLLATIFWSAQGGMRRISNICTTIIPIFLVLFVGMSSYVLAANITKIPDALATIMRSAFTGHAAVGGFAGSTLLLAMSQGMARGCYTGDIGVGYASVVHAETNELKPERQARLVILGIILDTFIVCTFSTIIIIVTDVWQLPLPASELIKTAFADYFPGMQYFMPVFIFLLGFSTIIAFFYVGVKSAEFITLKYGKPAFYCFAAALFLLFSTISQKEALIFMSITGATLLLINLAGIYKLKHEIVFSTKD